MTIPLGHSGSFRANLRVEDMSEMPARSKTSTSSKNITPRDSVDLLKHSYYANRPLSPVISPASETRSGTTKRSRSFKRRKASDQSDADVGHKDLLIRNDPPWRMGRKDEPHSAKASFWMDKRLPGHYDSPLWDEAPRLNHMRPRSGQNGIEEPPRSAVSRASSYPDASPSVGSGSRPGRWHLLGGLFAKKSVTSQEPSSPASTMVSPRFEVHIEGGTVKKSTRAAIEDSRGLFRSRSKREPVKHNSRRANTAPIRTTDISKPIPIISDDHNQGHIPRACGSTKPVLDVEIPSVKLERYSVMFGNLLENHSSTPSSLLVRRQKNVDRLKDIESNHDDNIGRCQIKLDPLKASNMPKPALATTHACLSTQKHDPGSPPRPGPNPSKRPPGLQRSLTASTVLSSPKPNANAQHLVVMVHEPKRTSSVKVKQTSIESPPIPSSYHGNSKTAPSSPLERVLDTGTSKYHHYYTQAHEVPNIKAEISIARQVSISRQRQHIKHVPASSSRTERLVDGSRALTPRVVQMQRGQSRRSQTGLLELA